MLVHFVLEGVFGMTSHHNVGSWGPHWCSYTYAQTF